MKLKSCLLAGCVAGVCLLLSPGISFGGDELMVITEDYPPLNYVKDKELKGPAVDIVRAIKDRLGVKSKIKVYPWARGYKYLETRKNTALFSTTRSEKREPLFKWVGPLAEKKIGFFAKRDRKIKLKTVEDAKDYLIGVQRGGVGIQYLEEWGLKNFDPSATASTNLKKLMAGHNDLWLASNATLAGNCKKLNVDVNEFELVLETKSTLMAIAFNKDTPDAIIGQWQRAYEGLVKEGVVKKIFQKHNLEGLYPSFYDD